VDRSWRFHQPERLVEGSLRRRGGRKWRLAHRIAAAMLASAHRGTPHPRLRRTLSPRERAVIKPLAAFGNTKNYPNGSVSVQRGFGLDR